MVGAGEEVKGRPAVTVAVGAEVTVVVAVPARDPVA